MNKNRGKLSKMLYMLAFWWAGFVILTLGDITQFQVLNIIAFSSLIFIPGCLTLLSTKLKKLEPWIFISLSVALSVLELMLIGFFLNLILPYFGVVRPLDMVYLLWALTLFVSFLGILVIRRQRQFRLKLLWKGIINDTRSIAYSLFPLLFVAASVLGATSLNNGGGNIFTMLMLGFMSLYLVVLFLNAQKLNENVVPTALYWIALSLLFMTSLRGWNITGHDIQLESKVFELTNSASLWSISKYVDAYNACLSITILPTIVSKFMSINDIYIYKVLFQMIFALIAPILYSINRRWLDKGLSLLATMLFIGFPTFFEDMPFLVRQEIAFIFYGLMIYLISTNRISLRLRLILFSSLGVGVILSHYSTTYTVLFIFVAMIGIYFVFTQILKLKYFKDLFSGSALLFSTKRTPLINIFVVVLLVVLNVFWTTFITGTGGNVVGVISSALNAAQNGFMENSRSIDAVNLISFNKPSELERMSEYVVKNVTTRRTFDKEKEYIDDRPTSAEMIVNLAEDKYLPLTSTGVALKNWGLNPEFFIPTLGKILAKLVQIAIILGIFYVLFAKKYVKRINKEFYFLALGCFVFVLFTIIVPVLSTEYGVYRAIQQSMLVLSLFGITGLMFLADTIVQLFSNFIKISSARKRKITRRFVLAVVAGYMLYSTNFIPQLFGANNPQLYLNNTGNYYDNYVTHSSEVAAITWLSGKVEEYKQRNNGLKPEVQADNFLQNKIKALTSIGLSENIFPELVKKDSFVFLGYTNATFSKASVKYNGDSINYYFDKTFFTLNKNLLYNNGEVQIYK